MQSASPASPMMNWLPIAGDFREDLRAALARSTPEDRLEGLASLAGHRLGFVETIQLDRALARLGIKEAAGFQPVRLTILASSTVDHLAPAIRVAGLRRRLLIEVHGGTYGQYRQDFIDPASALHRFQPQAACSRSPRGMRSPVSPSPRPRPRSMARSGDLSPNSARYGAGRARSAARRSFSRPSSM